MQKKATKERRGRPKKRPPKKVIIRGYVPVDLDRRVRDHIDKYNIQCRGRREPEMTLSEFLELAITQFLNDNT